MAIVSEKVTRSEQIVKLAEASPGIKTAEAAEILGMSKANLGTYTAKLRKEGLLKKTRGTLELEDGASAERPSTEAKKPKAAKAAKQPKASKEDQERLRDLAKDGLRRAELYRQEGVLTNILLVGKADGTTLITGVSGGPALSCIMLGSPGPKAIDDPRFQVSMKEFFAGLAGGDGEVTAFYNLTELPGDGGEPMMALMAGWIGGKRTMCAQAPLDDEPLNSTGNWRWKDLTADQAAKLCAQEFERHKQIEAESEEEETFNLTPFRLLSPDLFDPSEYMTAINHVMSDPERAPELIFTIDGDGEGEMQLGLRKLDPAVVRALATADGGEIDASTMVAHESASPQMVSHQMSDLILRACQQVEKERQQEILVNFVEVGMADGNIIRAGIGGGQALPMMTGLMGEQVEGLIAALGQGQGERAVFVSMMDLASDGVDRVLLSAFEGTDLVTAKTALIDGQPLDDPATWKEISAETLFEIGSNAQEVSLSEGDEQDDSIVLSAPMTSQPAKSSTTLLETGADQIAQATSIHYLMGSILEYLLRGLEDEGSGSYVLIVATEQQGKDPEVNINVVGTKGLDAATLMLCGNLSAICADIQPDYAAVAWGGPWDPTDGSRCGTVFGMGPGGERGQFSFLIDGAGEFEPADLMSATSLMAEMSQGFNEAAWQEIPLPQSESDLEALRGLIQLAAETHQGQSRFVGISGDGRELEMEPPDFGDEGVDYYKRMFLELPHQLREEDARYLAFSTGEGESFTTVAVSHLGTGIAVQGGQEVALGKADPQIRLISKVLTYNLAMEQAREKAGQD